MSDDLTLLCSYCDSRVSDESQWLEIQLAGSHDGCIACEQCQSDAAAHHGQMLDNIRHMKMFQRLIISWSEE